MATYKTQFGTIKFCKEKRYFIFKNPSIVQRPEDEKDKRETIVFMDAMRQLIHCLPDAKLVASDFADMMVTGGTTEEMGDVLQLDGPIYYEVLALFEGNTVARPIQHVLTVSIFNGKAYIWLKRYFRDDQCGGEWKACRGGYHFGLNDDENAILEYATECIRLADEERKKMKNQLELIAARVGRKRPAE